MKTLKHHTWSLDNKEWRLSDDFHFVSFVLFSIPFPVQYVIPYIFYVRYSCWFYQFLSWLDLLVLYLSHSGNSFYFILIKLNYLSYICLLSDFNLILVCLWYCIVSTFLYIYKIALYKRFFAFAFNNSSMNI